MMKYFKHFKTIIKHKYYVLIECCKLKIPLQGLTHDLSKFLPSEFLQSAKYWTGTGSPVAAERDAIGYSYAWRFHKGRNRHHWQWYVDCDGWDDCVKLNAAPMPLKYIKEMYADMVGAAKAYGRGSAKEYYLKHMKEWVLHPETKEVFEEMLKIS